LDTTDNDVDRESNFTILYKTNCPAILTENFFMDTEKDCRLIMSNAGRQKIANAHVRAIQKVIDTLY
jgi:N-acetylmuramoyl-L-alanine amidase